MVATGTTDPGEQVSSEKSKKGWDSVGQRREQEGVMSTWGRLSPRGTLPSAENQEA